MHSFRTEEEEHGNGKGKFSHPLRNPGDEESYSGTDGWQSYKSTRFAC